MLIPSVGSFLSLHAGILPCLWAFSSQALSLLSSLQNYIHRDDCVFCAPWSLCSLSSCLLMFLEISLPVLHISLGDDKCVLSALQLHSQSSFTSLKTTHRFTDLKLFLILKVSLSSGRCVGFFYLSVLFKGLLQLGAGRTWPLTLSDKEAGCGLRGCGC